VRNAEGFPWAQNTHDRVALLHPDLKSKIDGEAFVGDQYEKTLRECDILPGNSPTERRMKQMVNLNFRWFMQTLLDRKDRMSMYHGLEVRVPFCDHRIAQYMYAVPWQFKDLDGREKGLLRKAVEGLLPDEVLYRRKSPYPKTHHPLYRSLIYGALQELLERPQAPIFRLMDRDAMAHYIESEPAWPWYGQLMAMPQTMAYFLQINHWIEHYGVEPVW
jgi:asparagine synthase (glutamine-hydrolysing)